MIVQDPGQYGYRSVNPKTAFDIGFQRATQGMGSSNPTMSVKNMYEQQLRNYLKKLPADMDLSQIPDKYRNNLSNYLSKKKNEYVRNANIIDELVVGSQDYMKTVAKMNEIKNSFENLNSQFKLYGENKKTIIEDIEGQTTSMYNENQQNINMLRAIYNEEYDLNIDDYGNLSFIGDDGEIKLNDLPDYGIKDYETAKAMMDAGVKVYQLGYKSGVALTKENPQYFQIATGLKAAIDKGGKNSLMSVLHDGLVGDIVMADDPIIKGYIEDFNNGEIPFAQLRDIVVDNYMNVLLKQSQLGVKNRPKKSSSSRGRGGSGGSNAGGTGSGGNLTATDKKAFNTVNMIANAFDNKDIVAINRLMPNNIEVKTTIDPTVLSVNGVDIKFGTKNGFLDLLDQAGINPIYWPNVDDAEPDNNNSGGAADNF
tara:strand:- start:7379 stop:8653 length:1275 start_codon:yes stop_codon:yes gene_type:complete